MPDGGTHDADACHHRSASSQASCHGAHGKASARVGFVIVQRKIIAVRLQIAHPRTVPQLKNTRRRALLTARCLAQSLSVNSCPARRHRGDATRIVGDERHSPGRKNTLHFGEAYRPVLSRHDQSHVVEVVRERDSPII